MALRKQLPRNSSLLTDDKFLQVIQDHFPYIRENGLYEERFVQNVTVDIYRGDFHGLLLSLGCLRDLLHINTIFNGYLSTLDYHGESRNVAIIQPNYINTLFNIFQVQNQ